MSNPEVAEVAPISAAEAARATRNPLRKLYYWTLHWADTKYALPALFVVSFAESSFFPIPPDVLLIGMCFAAPTRWFRYALWCSIASVLGGIFGYFIGATFWELLGQPIVRAYHGEEVMLKVRGWYDEMGFMGIILAAITPIPYKVFTIASGLFQFDLMQFIAASAIGRSFRFFLVAWLIRSFGARIKPFLEKHFEWCALALGALAVLGFVALKYLR